jgi:type II secretory pathway component GspD/PulD (secretin)
MRLLVLSLVVAVLTGPQPAIFAGEPQTGSKQDLIRMNFDNVDISVLAKFISQITGKNFVLDESVSGKVTIIAPAKVTPAQAYCIFESALQLKGFTTVGTGPVIKIMPSHDARASASLTHSQAPAGQCAQPIAPNGTMSAVHRAAAIRTRSKDPTTD